MHRTPFVHLALALTLFLLVGQAGCDSGPLTLPGGNPDAARTSFTGTLDVAEGGWNIAIDRVHAPDGPIGQGIGSTGSLGGFGGYVQNVRYNGGYRLLLADLSLANACGDFLRGPVTLTFRDIQPDTVWMWEPPNPELSWEVPLRDEATWWGNGNFTETITVGFRVGRDVPVTFAADVGVGWGAPEGLLTGLVWHDLDGDGERDSGEPGVDLATVRATGSAYYSGINRRTGTDGVYAFTGQRDADYRLEVFPGAGWEITTAPALACTLRFSATGVDSVLGLDFGVRELPARR